MIRFFSLPVSASARYLRLCKSCNLQSSPSFQASHHLHLLLPSLPPISTPMELTLPTLILLSLAFTLLYLVLRYPDRYIFTPPRPDLPGPRGVPLFGNLFQFYPWRAKSIQWMCWMLPQYNDLVAVTMPPWGRALVIGRPEWLVHVKLSE